MNLKINNKPIIFLDYDGVVNTVYWSHYFRNKSHPRGVFRADFATPSDGFVNNFQAICWLNETYKQIKYDIVVTSTWRMFDNYKECLYNGGLNKEIKILGKTPIINHNRALEIKTWMQENSFNGKYVILDDDNVKGMSRHLVKCDTFYGYGIKEMHNVIKLLNS